MVDVECVFWLKYLFLRGVEAVCILWLVANGIGIVWSIVDERSWKKKWIG